MATMTTRRIIPLVAAVALSALAIVLPSRDAAAESAAIADDAAGAPACVDELEQRGNELIFQLDWTLDRQRLTPDRRFASIRDQRAALLALEHGDAARACLGAHPEYVDQIAGWMERFGHPALDRAQQRLDEICIGKAEVLISSQKRAIDRAMRANRLADAAHAADRLERGLLNDVITDCPAVSGRVDALLAEFIPDVRRAVALPKVRTDLRDAYTFVAATLAPTRKALATGGKTIAKAPAHLTTDEGRQELTGAVLQCVRHATALRSLGASDGLTIEPAAESKPVVTLREVEGLCRRTAENLDALFAQIATHNDAYHAEQRRKWEWTHIKGWNMQQVYDRLGRPAATELSKTRQTIEWTYRDANAPGRCAIYRFNVRGKRLGKRRARCLVTVADLSR